MSKLVYTEIRNLSGWRRTLDFLWFHLSWRIIRTYLRLWCRLKVEGEENIPTRGGAILASNHLNFIDGLVILAVSPRKVSFMIAREYYESLWFGWYCRFLGCIPVNRNGRELNAVKKALRGLSDGLLLGVFPEGGITQAEVMADAKIGTALLAIRSGCPVVPIRLSGYGYQSMLRSVFTPKKVSVRIGTPLRFGGENHKDRETLERVTEEIARAIRNLKDDH